MAKRLLLFVVLYFVSVSFIWGQCEKEYTMTVNKKSAMSSEYLGNDYRRLNFCKNVKANLQVNYLESDSLKFRWFRNDTLVTQSASLETDIDGLYMVEIQSKNCTYKIGKVHLVFLKNIEPKLSTQELTICENIGSPKAITVNPGITFHEVSYQWQKNGVDMPNQTQYYIFPQNSGIYTVRVTSESCSTTSQPVNVQANKDNKITNYLRFEPFGEELKRDTIQLCKDYDYSLSTPNDADWYLNGEHIAKGYYFHPTKSGLYYTSAKYSGDCVIDTKPVYISLDTKISPLNLISGLQYIFCGTKTIYLENPNFKGNNQLNFYDNKTNQLRHSFSNLDGYFFEFLESRDYRVEYQTGNCKTEPSSLDLSKNKAYLYYNDKKIDSKKITLCNNAYVELKVRHITSDEVTLYKNGVLVQKKQPSLYDYTGFLISETGKYHIRISDPNCTVNGESITDTVEIVAPQPISTQLSISSTSCESSILAATQYEGVSYYWYKDKTIIPNQTSSTLTLNKNETGTYYAVLQKDLCSVNTESIVYGNQISGETNLCQDSKFRLESKVKSGSILWKGPNGFTSNEAIINIDKVQPEHAGWYVLSTKVNDCSFKDSVKVVVIKKPVISFEFASPFCLNQDLVVKFKANPGYYYLNYSLFGGDSNWRSFQVYDEYGGMSEKYVNLGKIEPTENKEFFTLQSVDYTTNTVCSYPLTIPPHAITPPLVCNDIVEFTNLKETYCYQEKFKLKLKLPASLPKNKKLKIILETFSESYHLGIFSGDSILLSMPDISGSDMYFIIEDEDGKFITNSKTFAIKGAKLPVYAIVGNAYISGTMMHCEGYSTKLRTSVFVGENQSVQWRKNGADIAGATKVDFEAKESGLYSVAFVEGGCAVESERIEVIKGAVPKANLTSLIGIQNACTGFSVPLAERGYFPYTGYEWKRNGQIIEKKVDRNAFEAKETGYYKVTVSQGSCKETSDSVLIKIGDKNLLNKIFAEGNTDIGNNKVTICDQTSANLYHTNYYFTSVNDTALAAKYGFSFQWKRDNKNIAGANKAYYSSNEPGLYQLQMRQGDCIANSNKVEVVRQNVSSIKLINNYDYSTIKGKDTLVVCSETALYLYAYETYGAMYNWNKELYKDGKLINSYSVKNDNSTMNSFPIKDSGKYSIKLYPENQKNCIAYTDTSNVLFADRPLQLPMDTVFSCNDSITLYAPDISRETDSNGYQWSFKNKIIGGNSNYLYVPNEEGIYTVEINEGNRCSTIQSILVKRNIGSRLIAIDKDPVNGVINFCEGADNRLISYNQSGIQQAYNSSYTTEWYRNQQKLPDTVSSINANQPGEYFVRTKYRDCETKSNSIKVEVSQIKNQITPKADSLGICINGGFQILETNKENGYTYEWFKDNTALGEMSSTLKASQTGTYKALIQSGDCSVLTPKVRIYSITQLPTATISGDTTLNIGDTANLKLSFTSSPPFTYKLSNNQEGTSDKNTIIQPIKIQESTIFKLASIKNACGEGTVSGEAKINIIILGNEPLIGHKITIAPVPAESYCEIIFDLPVSQEVSYQLLDMKGQQLSEKNLGQVTYKKQYLNLNNLTAGEYLIRIQVGKDFVTRKLIKY
ncbi:T9SS type A sorting domain-containing protein [Emticicia sp. C21]|uniref:T9SS type A sorting domain-containing protein n=1 Tax=Emticicia sp. C21 TaxID=2302915 RepID=UPI000E3552C5|nr:T9SS type A sorting domain-containing protein [Emticicia sp. C21]RFS16008.1 T9SS C-terminal target domain-containing protein [Emticicia sp. C21]